MLSGDVGLQWVSVSCPCPVSVVSVSSLFDSSRKRNSNARAFLLQRLRFPPWAVGG